MTHKLLVQLPATLPIEGERLSCQTVQADGSVETHLLTVSDMARLGATQVLAIVTATALSWHWATLPAGIRLRGDARLLPVLQNLLEDKLLDEAEHAHVALAPDATPGQPCLLAVCSKPWLGAWLQTLESAGLKINRTLPQVPPDALLGASHGNHHGNTPRIQPIAICSGHAHGAWITALAPENIDASLPTPAAIVVTLPLPPDDAITDIAAFIHADTVLTLPATYADAAHCLGKDRVQLVDESTMLNTLLHTQWDLAQHGFASRPIDRWRRQIRVTLQEILQAPQWRSTRWACAVMATVLVIGLNVQAVLQTRALAAKRAEITRTAQQAFPQLRVVVDAPVQMQRELQTLRQSTGLLSTTDFQPLAAAAGAALKDSHANPTSVEYTGTELMLRGWPVDADQIVQTMTPHLQDSAYIAEAAGNAVRLRVREHGTQP